MRSPTLRRGTLEAGVDDQRWECRAGRCLRRAEYGVPCTVVAIETAPQTKLDRMRALGAEIVPVSYERAWVAAESHEFPGIEATFVHPFDNHDFIAGHGTMGLEIVEDCPDVRTVICAIGGGGLITGVGSAVKAMKPDVKVLGAEPETAAPYALSLREGGPRKFADWQARLSMARAARASPSACGSGCSRWSMARSRDARRDPRRHAADR